MMTSFSCCGVFFHMESYELIDKELSSYRKRKGSVTLDRNYEDLVLKLRST
jgi:hypothetical protein